jgi:hypothetical protein
VHSGRDPSNGDRVVIHSYDLSAASAGTANPENLARREFEVVRNLQKSPYLPSLVDSWQPIPNYAGEIFFFSLAESGATKLSVLASDPTWGDEHRFAFASRAMRALAELQEPTLDGGTPVLHRDLNPDTIRVRSDGAPLFAGWRWARLPSAETIASARPPEAHDPFAAPEIRTHGLTAATTSSDVYSLCKTLLQSLPTEADVATALRSALALGLDEDPRQRATAHDIAELINTEAARVVFGCPGSQPPVASRWDEGYIFTWENQVTASSLCSAGVVRGGRSSWNSSMGTQTIPSETTSAKSS